MKRAANEITNNLRENARNRHKGVWARARLTPTRNINVPTSTLPNQIQDQCVTRPEGISSK